VGHQVHLVAIGRLALDGGNGTGIDPRMSAIEGAGTFGLKYDAG
jgi:hypothetical protein